MRRPTEPPPLPLSLSDSCYSAYDTDYKATAGIRNGPTTIPIHTVSQQGHRQRHPMLFGRRLLTEASQTGYSTEKSQNRSRRNDATPGQERYADATPPPRRRPARPAHSPRTANTAAAIDGGGGGTDKQNQNLLTRLPGTKRQGTPSHTHSAASTLAVANQSQKDLRTAVLHQQRWAATLQPSLSASRHSSAAAKHHEKRCPG